MRKWLRPLPVWLALVLVPVSFAIVAPRGSPHGTAAVLALGLVLGFLLSLATHEAGHLLGARLAGFRFALCVVGPIKVRRSQRSLRIQVNDQWTPLGLVLVVPVHLRNLKRRMALMIAGGPLANLLLAVLIAGLFLTVAWVGPSEEAVQAFLENGLGQGLFAVILGTGGLSLGVGIGTLVPERRRGFLTDGARLLMLLRGGAKAERWSAVWALMASSAGGQRPREWDRELIDRATQLPDGSLDDAGACQFAYQWALDQGDWRAAGAFLHRAGAIAETIPALRSAVLAETVFFDAGFRGETATARARLDQAQGGFLERHDRLRAETALLLAERRVPEARERALEALAALEDASSIEAGGVIMYAEWLRDIGAQSEGAQPTSAPQQERRKPELLEPL